jgi:hypothetical protein
VDIAGQIYEDDSISSSKQGIAGRESGEGQRWKALGICKFRQNDPAFAGMKKMPSYTTRFSYFPTFLVRSFFNAGAHGAHIVTALEFSNLTFRR